MLQRRKKVLFLSHFDLQQTSVVDASWSGTGKGAANVSFSAIDICEIRDSLSTFLLAEIIILQVYIVLKYQNISEYAVKRQIIIWILKL